MDVKELKTQLQEISGYLQKFARNEKFRKYCERKINEYYASYDNEIMKKIAHMEIDPKLWKFGTDGKFVRNREDIILDNFKFFESLDSIYAGDINLENEARNNFKYIKISEGNKRSSCGYKTPDEGEIERKIVWSISGTVLDSCVLAHELTHSFGTNFKFARSEFKDVRLKEMCSCITNQLYLEWEKQQYPDIQKPISRAQALITNNAKIKALLPEMDVDICTAISKKYGDIRIRRIFEKYFPEINDWDYEDVGRTSQNMLNYLVCIKNDIYKDFQANDCSLRFKPFFDALYVENCIIAEAFLEKFKKSPKEAVKSFKEVIKNGTTMTQSEAVEKLGLGNIKELVDDFCRNYNQNGFKKMNESLRKDAEKQM